MTSRNVCRICGSSAVTAAGEVEYIAGYRWTVHDCAACGCRFTRHDERVYETLHETGAISYYSDYRRLARQCMELFARGDAGALRRALCARSKYRFIIDRVSAQPVGARMLEIGCSRGYLTSYFILAGRNVLGVDAAAEPVADARDQFGDYFAVAGDPEIERRGPYDIVYHVGMIGCVADPLGLTRDLFKQLRPGGKLLFNAPNRDALRLPRQLWLDSAPPPDVVTLFPPGFWERQFASVADVSEQVEAAPARHALSLSLRRLARQHWKKPEPKSMNSSGAAGHSWFQKGSRTWRLFERAALKAARMTGLESFAPTVPAEFGLMVEMVRK